MKRKFIGLVFCIGVLLGLSSCNPSVKPNDFKVGGNTVDFLTLNGLRVNMDEYLEENVLKNTWYNVEIYEMIEQQNYSYYKDYKKEIEIEGEYFYTSLYFNTKIHLNYMCVETYVYNNENYKITTNVDYKLYKGEQYAKIVKVEKSDNKTTKTIDYTFGYDTIYSLYDLRNIIENPFIKLNGYNYIYEINNGFQGESEVTITNKSVSKCTLKYNKNNYRVTKYESYNKETTTYGTNIKYIKLDSKLTGLVTKPNNLKYYQ